MMKLHNPKALAWVTLAVLLAGALPAIVYWHFFVRPPSVTVAQAKALLATPNTSALLVDLRVPQDFASNHVAGAVNLPFEQANKISVQEALPGSDKSKSTILLLCDTGLGSALVTTRLRSLGWNALSVRGGMLAWQAASPSPPSRSMPLLDQILAASLVFLIKPFYMLVSFIIIVVLWKREARDLVFFRWGLVIWWLGENACSVNYLFYNKVSDFWEYLHNYGMVAGFSLMAYAFIEGLDHRVIRFTDPKEHCALLGLCRTCYKYAAVPCGLQRLFHITIPATIAMSLMPLGAALKPNYYATKILGTSQEYSHMMSCQLFEDRYCAALAFFLLVASWLVLLFKKPDPMPWAKILFAAALGPLTFGLMRLFLFAVYSHNLAWLDIFEEYTEMLLMLGIAMTLWVFRKSLFARPTPQPAAEPVHS